MRKKSLLGLVILMIGACGIFTVSCNKATVDSNTTTATDNALVEQEFMRLLPMVNSLCHSHKGKNTERIATAPHYPVVTDTDHVYPKHMYINYGTSTVDSSDGRTRSGKITVTFGTNWSVYGFGWKATLTFSNYSVTTATGTASYVGSVYLEHLLDSTFSETTGGAIVTIPGYGHAMTYTCSRTFYWAQGHNDSVASHSVYFITGNGSGADHNQVQYTDNITSTIWYLGSCTYLERGTIQIIPAGNSNRTVTFGNTCTSGANVAIDGNSYSITLQ